MPRAEDTDCDVWQPPAAAAPEINIENDLAVAEPIVEDTASSKIDATSDPAALHQFGAAAASISALETFEQAREQAEPFLHKRKTTIERDDASGSKVEKWQRRAAVARVLWGPLCVVEANVQRCRRDLEQKLTSLQRADPAYMSAREDLILLLQKYSEWQTRQKVDATAVATTAVASNQSDADTMRSIRAMMEIDADAAFSICKSRAHKHIVIDLLIFCSCKVSENTISQHRQLFQMLVAEYGEQHKDLLTAMYHAVGKRWVRDVLAPILRASYKDWQEVERNSGRPELRDGLHRFGRRAYRKFLSGEALAVNTWLDAMIYIAHYDLVECVQALMDIWQGSDDEMWILIHQSMSHCVDQNSVVYNFLNFWCRIEDCKDCLIFQQ